MTEKEAFVRQILNWYEQQGRKHLPWQQSPSPYRVWISEIMLQQTQVSTVIPFYERFMQRFPTVFDLAQANVDEVLHLWTGLGYYARARNLHKTAFILCADFNGEFPQTVAELEKLPGIGRSTAGAILSLSRNIPAPILDGNVKRVLARIHKVDGWPGETKTQQRLWQLAQHYTPHQQVRQYNQAMMDLGATICLLRQPRCLLCPVQAFCQAHSSGSEDQYPTPKPRQTKPVHKRFMLMAQNSEGEIWLEKRPEPGVWGGLWSFPESEDQHELTDLCRKLFLMEKPILEFWPKIRHTFTHFHLEIAPVRAFVKRPYQVMTADRAIWYNRNEPAEVGLAAPVKQLLQML